MVDRDRADAAMSFSRRSAVRRGVLTAGNIAGLGGVVTSSSAAQSDSAGATPATPEVPDDFKVVLHAAEVQHWPYVVSNLRNLTTEWPRAQLRVVVDGSAVTAMQGENNLTRDLGELSAAGVTVQVCPNALREHGIASETVPAFAETSLGGVVALVLAHREGYVYVKP